MFWINNVLMPTPDEDGIEITENIIWSSNAGRTANGTFVGDVIARKKSIAITYSRKLTTEEIATLKNAISATANLSIKVLGPGSTSYVTAVCYAVDTTYTLHKKLNNRVLYNGLSLSFVEQ